MLKTLQEKDKETLDTMLREMEGLQWEDAHTKRTQFLDYARELLLQDYDTGEYLKEYQTLTHRWREQLRQAGIIGLTSLALIFGQQVYADSMLSSQTSHRNKPVQIISISDRVRSGLKDCQTYLSQDKLIEVEFEQREINGRKYFLAKERVIKEKATYEDLREYKCR